MIRAIDHLLTRLACVGNRLRLDSSIEVLECSSVPHNHGTPKSSKTLAMLFMALDPAATFIPWSGRACFPAVPALLIGGRPQMPARMADVHRTEVDGITIEWPSSTESVRERSQGYARRGGSGRGSANGGGSSSLSLEKLAEEHADGLRAFAVRDLKGGPLPLVDIGVNLAKLSRAQAEVQLRRAALAGVTTCIATGTSISGSKKSLALCRGLRGTTSNGEVAALFYTAGVHPHHASDAPSAPGELEAQLRDLYQDPLCVSIGECGLDYDRMRSPRERQLEVFAAQAQLAVELDAPLFCHERDLDTDKGPSRGSHDDFCRIVEEAGLRPERVCVHCYTGSEVHLLDYVERGYMIGLTGFIGMHRRAGHLRKALASGALPLSRLMVETDAPYMKPDKQYLPTDIGLRDQNEPCVTPAVVRIIAELLGEPAAKVAKITTANARRFFAIG